MNSPAGKRLISLISDINLTSDEGTCSNSYIELRFPDCDENHLLLADSNTLGYISESGELIAFFKSDADIAELMSSTNMPPRIIPEEDWNQNWKRLHSALRIGPFYIRAPWMPPLAAPGNSIELIIDPGMAFGTGSHETTRTCLGMLSRLIRSGDSFLDMGCGSGILSIAAARLGAAKVLGVDHDTRAIEAAKRNAETNGVSAEFIIQDRVPDGQFNVTAANIQSSILHPLMKQLKRSVKDGGHLVLSGLLSAESAEFDPPESFVKTFSWITMHYVVTR